MSEITKSRTTRPLVSWAVWPILLMLFASVGFVSANVVQQKQISPFDEYVYLDYLSKVPTQGFVRSGEETGDVARQEISCRGVQTYGLYGTSCDIGAASPDETFPYSGQTGADIYTPAYFAVTWVLAQPLVWTGVSLLDAGRLVGAVWLFLGISLIYALLRALRVPVKIALGLALVVIATPAVYWATAYVSTDAPTLAVGAGLGLLAVTIAQGRAHWAWLALASVAAILFKVQNLAAIGVCCLALVVTAIIRARQAQQPTPRVLPTIARVVRSPLFIGSVISALAAIAAQAAWLVFRSQSAVPGVGSAQVDQTKLPMTIQSLVDEAFTFIFAVGETGIPAGTIGFVVTHVLTFLAVGAIVALLLRPRPGQMGATAIGGSTLAVALLLGPGLALATWLLVGYYVPLPQRYGLVLLPAFIVCIGLLLDDRGPRLGTIVAAGGILCAGAAIFSSLMA